LDTDIEQEQIGGGARSRLRVIGVDPGSQATGYGVIDRVGSDLCWVAHGVLRPSRSAGLSVRLAALVQQLAQVIAQYAPDVASVEDVFVAVSPRSALVLGQARGAALAALGTAAIPLAQYAPARIKQAVAGNGRAGKEQMQRMVKRTLALASTPAADAADALAAAICHARAGPLERVRRPRLRPRIRLRDVDPQLLRWAR
jgi:crossover junction endodeoxyribonuclease RuvC